MVLRAAAALALVAALATLAPGCGGDDDVLPQRGDSVRLDPADFVAGIDNPWLPLVPGSRWVYRATAPDGTVERVEVTVTSDTRTVAGIEATVVHDLVTQDGEPVEDTLDWYAQDRDGNVWYLGEDTKEYEDGEVVSTAGSWEAGVDGAEAGIAMPAEPRAGLAYRQEHAPEEAEDEAVVVSVDERVEVPAGSWDGVVMTRDTTPLEPDVSEHKLYAHGVGPVLVLGISGGAAREELVSHERGG